MFFNEVCLFDVPCCVSGLEAESSVPAAQTEQSRGDHRQTQERPREQKQRWLVWIYCFSTPSSEAVRHPHCFLFIVTVVGTGTGMVSPTRAPGTVSLSPARVPDVDPIDAAAHLQLLGESLSLIGHRLQETEVRLHSFSSTSQCRSNMIYGRKVALLVCFSASGDGGGVRQSVCPPGLHPVCARTADLPHSTDTTAKRMSSKRPGTV